MSERERALDLGDLYVASGRAPEPSDEPWIPSTEEIAEGIQSVARERAERILEASARTNDQSGKS
jgi:hypothetical protein